MSNNIKGDSLADMLHLHARQRAIKLLSGRMLWHPTHLVMPCVRYAKCVSISSTGCEGNETRQLMVELGIILYGRRILIASIPGAP
jgi:hypothetical protein